MKRKIGKILEIVMLIIASNSYGATVTEDFSSSKKIDTTNTSAVVNTNLKRTTLSVSSDLKFEDISSQVVGFSTNVVRAVGYNGSYWLVGGAGGKLNKYDGTTWTDITNSAFAAGGVGILSIEWNGIYWLIGGSSADGAELHKYDGTTWTELSASVITAAGLQFFNIRSIGWNGSYWLIGGTEPKLIKYDGTTWTNLSASLVGFGTVDIYIIEWNGSYWLIGGGNLGKLNRYDGTTFTDLTASYGSSGTVHTTEWNGAYWLIAGGVWETNPILKKYDGTTFTDLSGSLLGIGVHKLFSASWNSDYGYWLIGVDLNPVINRYDGSSFTNISSILTNVSSDISVQGIWAGNTWFIYGTGTNRSFNKGQHLYVTNNVLQSQKLNDISDNIGSATLTASVTLNGGSISYQLSADAGAHWETVTAGSSHTFKYPGKDLRYKATITASSDRKNTPILTQVSISYKTELKKIKAGEKGEVLSDDDIETKMNIPENSISKTLLYSIERTISPSKVEGTEIVLSYNFEAKDPDTNKVISNLEGEVEITIHYRSSDGKIYNTDNKEIAQLVDAKQKLGIGFYNGRYWVPLTSEVNVSASDVYVKTRVSHLSEYGIIRKISSSIEANVSPNPFTPKASQYNIVNFTFNNENNEYVELKIWDITGVLVRTITGYGTTSISWDGKDENGEYVEGGVYIYQLKVGNSKVKTGTVVVAY